MGPERLKETPASWLKFRFPQLSLRLASLTGASPLTHLKRRGFASMYCPVSRCIFEPGKAGLQSQENKRGEVFIPQEWELWF